jgi:hypothetical protein
LGNIIKRLGVKYLYIASFGVMTSSLLCIFVFVRETTYEREPTHISTTKALSSSDNGDRHVYDDTVKDPVVVVEPSSTLSPTLSPTSSECSVTKTAFGETGPEPKNLWTWYLRLYRGRLIDRSFIWSFLQPFPLLIFPSVLFSTVVNGAMLT